MFLMFLINYIFQFTKEELFNETQSDLFKIYVMKEMNTFRLRKWILLDNINMFI